MRPITIIPTTPVVASTAAASQQRPTSSPSNPETNSRPLSNGTSNPSNPEPKLSPLSPSSSTTSFISKKPLSKSDSKTEVNVTKKPPPAAAPKRSSLLSDSISKFEQNCDGGAKQKVSWKSFIKPSVSKDKLAVNGSSNSSNSTTTSANETETTSHEAKVKTLDENNNEVKSDEPKQQPDITAAISNAKPMLKPKPTITNGTASVILESKPESHPEQSPAVTNAVNVENGKTSSQNADEENSSLPTSPPPAGPVKVKRIVKKIIRRTVTKSSSDLSTLSGGGGEQQEGEKVVKIIKKKVIKAKPVEVEVGEDALVSVANQTSPVAPVSNGNVSDISTKTIRPEPNAIEHKPSNPLEINVTTSDLTAPDSPTTLLLNGKAPVRPQIRPMLPAHRAHTVDLGSAQETILKLPPTPPAIVVQVQSPLPPKTVLSPSMDRRRSWGKLDKMPLSLALSRDSTLDDFSRESSFVSPSRSTSPAYSLSSTRSSSVLSNYESWQSSRSVTPRRVQSHSYHESDDLEQHLQRIHPANRASPALSERSNASDYLSEKIDHFLKRTDYATQEWKRVGRSSTNSDLMNELYGTCRSKSVSSIMSRGLQLLRDHPMTTSRSSSRMSSVSRDESFQDCLDDDNRTVVDDNELSEMTAEFAEEHSSSNLISERLEAETTERLRLEKEVKEHEAKYRNLQESSEKLEMELLCAKSDLNGDLDDDLEGDEAGANAYRLKYERVARELEFTKKRLQTQHEHDLEQLIALKKQLEKKLADAYEEVEEQRQVVGQWKRKAQKMTNEMNDLRMLLEEQNSRNNLLEKRQRKFDSECQALQDSARQEKTAKERLAREKDVLIAEKFTIEQTLSDVRLELELKEEKYSALQRELEEMTFGGGTEEEIAQLKRQKMELDRRCKEQEEELDEMAGQIQLLEQAKLRLEMSLETMRKDARKEAQQRDDELEEVRGSSYKKIKSLECQLEQEHEERTLLLREKHDLERRLNNLEDQDRVERAAEEAASQKLKRDLRKYKALLRDAQSQLERAKSDSAGKALIRQLRNQLEDAESARSAAVKVRQVAESELQDVQLMLEEAQRARFDSEERATAAQRDRAELQAQIDENEEEMAELMKKYSATVKQLSSEQAMITDYELKISELESEKKSLKEQISDLTSRLESVENIGDSSTSIQFKRLELRTKELESRLEFEQATRARMEIQLNRHKDSLEKAQSEISQTRTKEMHAQDSLKKAQKTIRELREELHLVANKEQESLTKRKDLEKRLESVEAEAASARADLRLALQRIADLQQAMEEGDSYHSDSENSDSSIDSVSEVNYHSPTKISSLRARSGETNGTGTNGSSTTLCIREEKENTPRIKYKYKSRGLRRRRLPCTIAEEDEVEDSVSSGVDPEAAEDTDQLDSVIESIKSAIGDDREEDGADEGETTKVVPVPKYTGAIKKTNLISKNQVSLKDELALSDANNNVIPKGQSKTLESTIVAEIAKASTVVADHLNDDSRFDLNALKSIKEKIKSLNHSLKEEAAQERFSKYEFPPPPPIVLSASQVKLESGIPDRDTNASFTKLDQISAELNLEGIRSMKEKIRNLKKRLQDESGTSEEPINKAEIASEIVEMKKTLTRTAAFINKSSEKLSLSRSSSQKEEKPITLVPPLTNGCSKESSPQPGRSPVRNNSTSVELTPLIAQVSNGGPLGVAIDESRLVSSLEQGDVASFVSKSGSAENNRDSRECLLICTANTDETRVDVNEGAVLSPEEKTSPEEAAVNNLPPQTLPSIAYSNQSPLGSNQHVNVSNQDQSPLQCETDSLRTTSGSCEVTECKEKEPVLEPSTALDTDTKELSLPGAETASESLNSFALKITLNSINTAKTTNQAEEIKNENLEQNTDATSIAKTANLNDNVELLEPNKILINSSQEQLVNPQDVRLKQEIKCEESEALNTCSNIECRTSPLCKCENIEQTIELLVKSMEVHRETESVLKPATSKDLTTTLEIVEETNDSTEIQKEELEQIVVTKDVPNCSPQVPVVQQETNGGSIVSKESVSIEKSEETVVSMSQPVDSTPVDLVDNIQEELVETASPSTTNQTEETRVIVDVVEKLQDVDQTLDNSTLPEQSVGVEKMYETTSNEIAKEQAMTEEIINQIDENNNQDKPTKHVPPTTTKDNKGALKPSKSKTNCHHGSLKRNVKPDNGKTTSGSKSNPSSRRSSMSEHGSKAANTIYTDLAKGPVEKKQVVEVVPPPALSNVEPTEDMSKNQVSERALVVLVDQTQDCTNESSSCCSVVAPSSPVVVSTDVEVVVAAPSKGCQNSPRPLSYAESLKKARSPPKLEPWVAIKQEYANKAAAAAKQRKQQQSQPQQPRVRHPSLARNGSSGSIPRDGSLTIRQSKSATKVFPKDVNLSLLPNGKPNAEAAASGKSTTQNRSKSGQRNASGQPLVAKETNKSNPNLDKKLREAKGQPQSTTNHHHRQSRPTMASNSKKK